MPPRTAFRPLLCLPLALVLAHCARAGAGGEPAEPPTLVKMALVEDAVVHESSEYIATLKSRRTATLQPQIDGQVTRIFVASGDTVKQGDPIMQIDPSRQAALVSSEQATRTARAATLNYWRQQVDRLGVLYEGGAVSKQELDQARTSLDTARADVNALDAQVRQQQVQLQYYRVAAPASGVIGDVPVRVGDRVTPATVLTTLSQSGMLEAYVSVPVERAADLREGTQVQLIDNAGAVLCDTKVGFVSPLTNDGTQSVLAKALVGNEQGLLRPGQFVRARVVWAEHRAPLVPVVAVIRLSGQHFVYVVEPDGKGLVARQRAVTLGEISGNNYSVRAGLKPGARIVAAGVQKIRDGSPVTPEA